MIAPKGEKQTETSTQPSADLPRVFAISAGTMKTSQIATKAVSSTLTAKTRLKLEFPRFRGRLWAYRFQPFSGDPFVVDG